MKEVEEMMGLAEAAMMLKIPYQDAHRLLMTGKLRGTKQGGRWLVQEADVQRVALNMACRRAKDTRPAGNSGPSPR